MGEKGGREKNIPTVASVRQRGKRDSQVVGREPVKRWKKMAGILQHERRSLWEAATTREIPKGRRKARTDKEKCNKRDGRERGGLRVANAEGPIS